MQLRELNIALTFPEVALLMQNLGINQIQVVVVDITNSLDPKSMHSKVKRHGGSLIITTPVDFRQLWGVVKAQDIGSYLISEKMISQRSESEANFPSYTSALVQVLYGDK